MEVTGIVNRVAVLGGRDKSKYDTPLYSVSIEGFTTLYKALNGAEPTLPQEGTRIYGVIEVYWRKGARPLHFLRSFQVCGPGS